MRPARSRAPASPMRRFFGNSAHEVVPLGTGSTHRLAQAGQRNGNANPAYSHALRQHGRRRRQDAHGPRRPVPASGGEMASLLRSGLARHSADSRYRQSRTGILMAKRIQIEKGSGNVFADIGVPNPEEALAKAEIARQVNRILVARKLSQAEAGVILGIAQPRVSDLIRGRLGRFSLDKLLDFAKRSGNDVEIRIKPSRRPRLKVLPTAACATRWSNRTSLATQPEH